MIRINLFPLLVLPPLLLLAGCGENPFAERGIPRTATEVTYAKEVCDEAGPQARACDDARRQMDLRCYRTLGTVDCYRTDDPFGMSERDRAALAPIDRRPTRSSDLPPPEAPVVNISATNTKADKPDAGSGAVGNAQKPEEAGASDTAASPATNG
ncbi:MAG: hypothetical protein P1U65_04610 [Minwuia sp.]|nr:hypothetical protein [Minwuia sp.]